MGANLDIILKVGANTTAAEASVKKFITETEGKTAKIKIDVAKGTSKENINSFIKSVEPKSVKVPIKLDTSSADLNKQIQAIKPTGKVKIGVELDTNKTKQIINAEQKAIEQSAKRLMNKTQKYASAPLKDTYDNQINKLNKKLANNNFLTDSGSGKKEYAKLSDGEIDGLTKNLRKYAGEVDRIQAKIKELGVLNENGIGYSETAVGKLSKEQSQEFYTLLSNLNTNIQKYKALINQLREYANAGIPDSQLNQVVSNGKNINYGNLTNERRKVLSKQVKDIDKFYENENSWTARIAEMEEKAKSYPSISDNVDQMKSAHKILTGINEDKTSNKNLWGKIGENSDIKENLALTDTLYNATNQLNKAWIDGSGAVKSYDKAIESGKQVFASQRQILESYNKYHQQINKNYPELKQKIQDFMYATSNGTMGGSDAKAEAERIRLAMENLGVTADTTFGRIKKLFKDHIGTSVVMLGINAFTRGLSDTIRNVVKIDTAMTELKKVTNESASTYDDYLNRTKDTATRVGATIEDTINSSVNFARLGFNVEESEKLGEAALIYKNVGIGIENIDEASESIISVIQAFEGLSSDDALSIVDKMNEVGNNYAISSKGIGESLKRSAASLSAARNDVDQSIALITAANEVVQNPEKVGTGLKTTSMRLRDEKTREKVLSLTGGKVDTMLDENTYKSTYDILKEISDVWDKLSDKNQAQLLQQISGKANANTISALISNFDQAESVLETSRNSEGSATRENEKYLNSIEGKMSQLKAQWQAFSEALWGSDMFKNLIDFATKFLSVLTDIVEATGGWAAYIPILMGLNSIFGLVQKIGTVGSTGKLTDVIGVLGKPVSIWKEQIFGKKNESETGEKVTQLVLPGLTKTIEKQKEVANGTTKAAATLSGSITTAVAGLTALAIALAAFVGLYKLYKDSQHKNANNARDDLQKQQQSINNLSTYKKNKTYRQAEKKVQDAGGDLSVLDKDELRLYKSVQDKLFELNPSLSNAWDINGNAVNEYNLKLDDAIAKQKELNYQTAMKNADSIMKDTNASVNEVRQNRRGDAVAPFVNFLKNNGYADDYVNEYILGTGQLSKETYSKLYNNDAEKYLSVNAESILGDNSLNNNLKKLGASDDEINKVEELRKGYHSYNKEITQAAKGNRELAKTLLQNSDGYDKLNKKQKKASESMAEAYGELAATQGWSKEELNDKVKTINSDVKKLGGKDLKTVEKGWKNINNTISDMNKNGLDTSGLVDSVTPYLNNLYTLSLQSEDTGAAIRSLFSTMGMKVSADFNGFLNALAGVDSVSGKEIAKLGELGDTLVSLGYLTPVISYENVKIPKFEPKTTKTGIEGAADIIVQTVRHVGSYATKFPHVTYKTNKNKIKNALGGTNSTSGGTRSSGGGGGGGGGSSKKTKKSKSEKLADRYQKELNDLEHQLKMGKITEEEYWKYRKKLIDKYRKKMKDGAATYKQFQEDYYAYQKEKRKKDLEDLQRKVDIGLNTQADYWKKYEEIATKYYKDSNDQQDDWKEFEKEFYNWRFEQESALLDVQEEKLQLGMISNQQYWELRQIYADTFFKDVKGKEKEYADYTRDTLDDIVDYIQTKTQEIADRQESTINAGIALIDEEIDRLQKLNEEKEKENQIEKARQELERLKYQRTKLIYRAGVGYEYVADQTAIDEARKSLDELTFNSKIEKLEKVKEALEDMLSLSEKENNRTIIQAALGKDWDGDLSRLDSALKGVGDDLKKWQDVLREIDEIGVDDNIYKVLMGINWNDLNIDAPLLEAINKLPESYKAAIEGEEGYLNSIDSNIAAINEIIKKIDGKNSDIYKNLSSAPTAMTTSEAINNNLNLQATQDVIKQSTIPLLDAVNTQQALNINIGDIKIEHAENADDLAQQIVMNFPNSLIQEVFRTKG